ncbi:MAG: hydrolase of the superfamily, partial [Actinomycetia bacterium]|nr:hydrolase of the superfamily [Actinomycetes bacterium]
VIGIDADDTLWHSETLFSVTYERFAELLADHAQSDELVRRMLDTERRNLGLFGYGAKGFTLSMIETALDVTGGQLPGSHVQAILDMGKALLSHPVDLLEGVREAIEALADRRLVLVTKGDLFHQESKVAGSGLGELFELIEIVSEKDEATYRKVVANLGIDPEDFLMVGNALRSDVLPVVAIGGRAVHVPYEVDWAHEVVDEADLPTEGWWRLESLSGLPALLEQIER